MGKPATTYFCNNGHLVEDNPKGTHGQYDQFIFDNETEYPSCIHCGSPKILMVLGWCDPDYEQLVPEIPIKYEEKRQEDFKGNKYFIEIPVFDVSKVKK